MGACRLWLARRFGEERSSNWMFGAFCAHMSTHRFADQQTVNVRGILWTLSLQTKWSS